MIERARNTYAVLQQAAKEVEVRVSRAGQAGLRRRRTELVKTLSGDCSTPYPLSVRLFADGAEQSTYAYLQHPSAIVRAPQDGIIGELRLVEDSPWSGIAYYGASCRIGIDVYMNRPDVDSTAEAEAIVAGLQLALNQKSSAAEAAEQLLLLHQAYDFLNDVAAVFHRELTSDEIQELRASAIESEEALSNAIVSCDNGLSVEQKQQLFRLSVALGSLDHPEVWDNPDGTRKSISDFVGPQAAEVLAAVDEFAANGDPAVLEQLSADAETARVAAVEAQERLSLALTQLAEWLQ